MLFLDSFHQELKTVKSFINQIEKNQAYDNESVDASVEFGSPTKACHENTDSEWSRSRCYNTEKRERDNLDFSKTVKFSKHNFKADKSPSSRMSNTIRERKSIGSVLSSKNNYLRSIEK